MSSLSSTLPLYLLSLALLLPVVIGAAPLFHYCASSENFTANGPYESNLNVLMGYLHFTVPPTGFGLGSTGWSPLDRAYGLGLCRGDISTSDCNSCVVEASAEIRTRCPNTKTSAIWYDNCLLKYSGEDFFRKVDNNDGVKFYMWNTKNASSIDSTSFNQKTKVLLSHLSEKASATPKLYAAGDLGLGSEKIYGLVQCTRDLDVGECKKCVDGAISDLPSCCDGKQGGRVLGGSCNIRYETYPFFNA